MKRKILALLIIGLVGILITNCRQPQDAATTTEMGIPPVWEWATIGAYGTSDPEVDTASFRVNTEGMAKHAWWNQPSMVEALDLGLEERAEMDKVMAAYLSRWAAMGAKRTKGQERMVQAIKADDFESARRIADDKAWAAAYFQGSPMRLKVEIFALLSDDQMQRVIEEQPFLLNSKWMRSTSLKAE